MRCKLNFVFEDIWCGTAIYGAQALKVEAIPITLENGCDVL